MKTLNAIAPKSAPNAPVDSSVSSPPGQPSMVSVFVGLVEKGVGHFSAAGGLLVEMLKDDQRVFPKIITAAPWLTVDILWTFHRIGSKIVHPKVMLYSGQRILFPKLLAMSYAEQAEIVEHPERMAALVSEPRKRWNHLALDRSKPPKDERKPEPAPFLKKSEKENLLESAHHKEHGVYQIVIKPGKQPQFFKRTGAPMDAQRVRLMKDPDDDTALIANLELYEYLGW